MSYPFDHFRNRLWQTDSRVAYALYPFKDDSAGYKVCNDIVRPAVKDAGLDFDSAESVKGAYPVLARILDGIADADIVIGILVDSNPNVFWEIGLAMTWKPATQVLTIGKKAKMEERLPFNISGYHHVFIEPDNCEGSRERLVNEISAMKKAHESLILKSVQSASYYLGPAELKVVSLWGQKSNFYLQAHEALYRSEEYRQPISGSLDEFRSEARTVGPKLLATHIDGLAMGNLCRLGLLACNTATKRVEATLTFEYSFHWTPLGNRLLQAFGFIEPDEVKKRFAKLPPDIRTWRGGHLFSPALPH